MGKLSLILGGARSGKSAYAEKLAKEGERRVAYIATAQALDEEMAARIAMHRKKRSQNWQTLEIPTGVGQALLSSSPQVDVILLDCMTLLVTNLVMQASTELDGPDVELASARVEKEMELLLEAARTIQADWIVVSNEVGLGLVPPYPLGRVYRDLLGWANQQAAEAADEVILMVAGIPWRLKPTT